MNNTNMSKACGMVWKLDDTWVSCVSHADDLVLTASAPRTLESACDDMIRDFSSVGLGVGAEEDLGSSSQWMVAE